MSYGDRTNSDRARRALQAIEAASYNENGIDLEREDDQDLAHQAIKDLIGDLYHLADRTGVDFEAAVFGGGVMYVEECACDDPGDWPLWREEVGS